MLSRAPYLTSRAAILPWVLVVSALTSMIGVSALKMARQESEMAGLSQSVYLLDQAAEYLTLESLQRFQSNASCYSWHTMNRMGRAAGTLVNLPSGCWQKVNRSESIGAHPMRLDSRVQTNYCQKHLAAGYEVNMFAAYEFRTRSTLSVSSQSAPKNVARWQYWTLLGPIGRLNSSENYCEQSI